LSSLKIVIYFFDEIHRKGIEMYAIIPWEWIPMVGFFGGLIWDPVWEGSALELPEYLRRHLVNTAGAKEGCEGGHGRSVLAPGASEVGVHRLCQLKSAVVSPTCHHQIE